MKRPQLSLRDLFWLVLVCALMVGWSVDRTRLVQLINKLTDPFYLGDPVRDFPEYFGDPR